MCLTPSNEWSAVAGARAGDPRALEVLYNRFADQIYAVALRLLGSPADAEDVVHDVFLSLPQTLQSYGARGSFAGWIARVGARAALMKLRRARVAARAVTVTEPEPPDRTANRWIERMTLQTALEQLPEHLRTVFVLKEIVGYSHSEIAEMKTITVANSRVRLRRAREQLRSMVDPPAGGAPSSRDSRPGVGELVPASAVC